MTQDEIINHARYQMALWRREASLYLRLHRLMQVIQLGSGLSAIGTLTKGSPEWLSFCAGAVMALTVVVDFVFKPAELHQRAKENLAHWAALNTAAYDHSPEELQRSILSGWEVRDDAYRSLRNVAYNDMLVERGYPEGHFKLSLWQKLLEFMT